MIAEDSVNSQITDSVTQSNVNNIGNSPAHTMAMVEASSAESIGMAMHNAVTAQQNMQMLTSASITSACARMINMSGHKAAPGSTPPPTALPPLNPSSSSNTPPPASDDSQDSGSDKSSSNDAKSKSNTQNS